MRFPLPKLWSVATREAPGEKDAPIIEVQDLSFSYPSASEDTFRDVSFSLEAGHVLVLLGPNGTGKSTLLNCIAGMLRPKTGSVRLRGTDSSDLTIMEVARIVGYVPQSHNPSFGFTVREFVVMGRTPYLSAFAKPVLRTSLSPIP